MRVESTSHLKPLKKHVTRESLGFVCELGLGGEEKGMKGLWRGKPCLRVLKKQGKVLGFLKGFICPILKFPQIGGFGGLNIQIDNFVLIIIQNFNYNLPDKLQSIAQCIILREKKW